jgi:hypothetical protein
MNEFLLEIGQNRADEGRFNEVIFSTAGTAEVHRRSSGGTLRTLRAAAESQRQDPERAFVDLP